MVILIVMIRMMLLIMGHCSDEKFHSGCSVTASHGSVHITAANCKVFNYRNDTQRSKSCERHQEQSPVAV